MILTRRYNIDRFGYLIPHRYGNLPMMGAVATYRPGEGRFGGAVGVEEGTTNIVPDTDMTSSSWTKQNGCTVEKLNETLYGMPVYRVSFPAGQLSRTFFNFGYQDGEWFSGSIYYKLVSGHEAQEVRPPVFYFRETGFGTTHKTVGFQRVTSWQRIELNHQFSGSGSSMFLLYQSYPNTQTDTVMDFAMPQLEKKPFATSFVAGTRAEGRLSYPVNFNMDEGTIRCYFYLNKTAVINALVRYPTIFMARQGTGTRNWFWVYFNEPRTRLTFQRRNDSGSESGGMVYLSEFDELSDGWHDVAIVWDHASGVIRAYLDGEFKGTATYDKNDLIPFDRIEVGSGQGIIGASSLLFDELLILPYAASEEEIRAWYEADGPIPPHPAALLQWDWQAVRPATMVAL